MLRFSTSWGEIVSEFCPCAFSHFGGYVSWFVNHFEQVLYGVRESLARQRKCVPNTSLRHTARSCSGKCTSWLKSVPKCRNMGEYGNEKVRCVPVIVLGGCRIYYWTKSGTDTLETISCVETCVCVGNLEIVVICVWYCGDLIPSLWYTNVNVYIPTLVVRIFDNLLPF